MNLELPNFSELNLSDFLLRALTDMQFSKPTDIQAAAIPLMLEGRDMIAQAQTGTGKTAAFALPILQRIDLSTSATQALILAPTRELAIQTAEQFIALSACQRGIKIAVLCGGQDYRPQLKQLRDGAHIIVGTPGRILDHIERDSLKLNNLVTFVLDEADEMLRMGFIDDVETILAKLPDSKQMALFSATMPTRIRQIANKYLDNPASVAIRSDTATVKTISQRYLFSSPAQKPATLLRLLAAEDYQGVIVFVRTKVSCEEVAAVLQEQGYRAMAIHGDLSQPLREKIISQFRQGGIDILVATDVAARGLDVERVTHVINYDIPQDCETYVHRIGRTGRAGRAGVSLLLVAPRESRLLMTIERHTREPIEKIIPPSDAIIDAVRQKRFVASINERIEHENLPAYQQIITDLLAEHPDMSAVDVAAALALLHHQDKPWKTNLPKISSHDESRGSSFSSAGGGRSKNWQDTKRSEKGKSFRHDNASQDIFRKDNPRQSTFRNDSFRQDSSSQTLYRIEVGHSHGVKPGNIVGAIANEGGIASRFITGLKIHAEHSTVYLPQTMPKEVVSHLHKARVCGRQLKLASLPSGVAAQ